MALATTDPSKFFIDDDEVVYSLLLSENSHDSDDVTLRLTGLAERLQGDADPNWEAHWQALIDQASHELQTAAPPPEYPSFERLPESSSNNNTPLPAAFDTDRGKWHLQATQALLQVSPLQAVKLTLSAIHSVPTDSDNVQSLLGTRALLQKVLDYARRQKLVRLQVLAEALRQEESEVTRPFLDSFLPASLFRFLLQTACQPVTVLKRPQLEPARALSSSSSSSMSTEPSLYYRSSTNTTDDTTAYNQFVVDAIEQTKSFCAQERLEALEALLVLLYKRHAVSRLDVCLLLTGFLSTRSFFTDLPNTRLSRLASLISAECLALWRIQQQEDNWIPTHPLLQGLANGEAKAFAELRAVATLAFKCAQATDLRMTTTSNAEEEPESLVVLAVGLLLRATHQSTGVSTTKSQALQELGATGLQLIQVANDSDAFSYLQTVMQDFVEAPRTTVPQGLHERPYDGWLFSPHPPVVALQTPEWSAPSIAYASLGAEVLEASVQVLETTLLQQNRHPTALQQNLAMLADLAASIYRNSPQLTQQFWSSWKEYVSQGNANRGGSPLCQVVQAARVLATQALTQTATTESVLDAVAPFLQLVSCLVYNADITAKAVASILPDKLLSRTMELLSLDPYSVSRPNVSASRNSILQSLVTICRVGDSPTCRSLLRELLEPDAQSLQAPRAFFQMAVRHNAETTAQVLTLVAELARDAPVAWILEVARLYKSMQEETTTNHPSVLTTRDRASTVASVQVMDVLLSHIGRLILTTNSLEEGLACDLLRFATENVLHASHWLAASVSSTSRLLRGGTNESGYESARVLMDGLSTSLGVGRAILAIYPPPSRVGGEAFHMLDALLNALSSQLGPVVLYYATAPVSVSLALALDFAIRDANVLEQMLAGDEDLSAKYGSLSTVLSSLSTGKGRSALEAALLGMVNDPTSYVFDLEGMRRQGWLSKDESVIDPLCAARSALLLLNAWTSVVEDRLLPGMSGADESERALLAQVAQLGPFKLLAAPAVLAPAVAADATQASVWKKCGISNLDLLTQYVAKYDELREYPTLVVSVLDFFSLCLNQGRLLQDVDPSSSQAFLSAVFHCKPFHESIRQQVKKVVDLGGRGSHSHESRAELCYGLRAVGVFKACLDANVSIGVKLLGDDGSVLFKPLMDLVAYLQRNKTAPSMRLDSDATTTKMRVACACVGAIHSILVRVRSPPTNGEDFTAIKTLTSLVDQESEFIPQLMTVVTLCEAVEGTGIDRTETKTLCGWNVWLTLTSLAVDIVTMEMSLLQAKKDGRVSMIVAVEDLLKVNVAGLVPVSRRFLSLHGVTEYTGCSAEFSLTMKLPQSKDRSIPSYMHMLSLPTPQRRDCFVEMNGYSTAKAGQWYQCFVDSGDILPYQRLSVTYGVISNQLQRMHSWKSFCGILTLLVMPNGGFSESMCIEILRSLHGNLVAVETAHLEARSSPLVTEAQEMTGSMASMLLNFTSSDAFGTKVDEWIDCMDLISSCATKLFAVVFQPAEVDVVSMKKLLASATALLSNQGVSGSSSREHKVRSSEVCLRLSQAACKLVLAIERTVVEMYDGSITKPGAQTELASCLRVSVALLTILVSKARSTSTTSEALEYTYMSKLLRVFSDTGIVKSLAVQAEIIRGSTARDAKAAGPRMEDDVVLAIVEFFTEIAAAGDGDSVSLLLTNEALRILPRNVQFNKGVDSAAESLPLRGYISGRVDGSSSERASGRILLGRRDDPSHRFWKTCLRFVSALLRSSGKLGSVDVDDGSRMQATAVDFLHANVDTINACLVQCSSVTFNASTPSLTLSVLEEGALILSVASEAVEMAKQRNGELLDTLLRLSKTLVSGLSAFLGASGSSRELFKGIEDFESSDESIFDRGAPLLSHVDQILKSGISNAKHEAIRYSHFVSRCATAITDEDLEAKKTFSGRWKSVLDRRLSDPDSFSSLEHNCRSAVSSKFSFQLEEAAAECVFFALRLLWRTHPALSAFVMFSAEEAKRLDAMRLVKPGMVIAFRIDANESRSWLVPREEGGRSPEQEQLAFGRVSYSDTVNRRWSVSLMDSPNETSFVSALQLAGVEDLSKRKCVLAFAQAPDSSSNLERAGKTLSLGHLILVLRWCSQIAVERRAEQASAGPAATRLAELATAFVGAEVAVRRELGQAALDPASVAKMATQLLDLFGEAAVAHSFLRDGRLKDVLTGPSWDAIRQQLRTELDFAITHIESKQNSSVGFSGWNTHTGENTIRALRF